MDLIEYFNQNPSQIPIGVFIMGYFIKEIGIPFGRWFGKLFSTQSETTRRLIESHEKETMSDNALLLRFATTAEENAKANVLNAETSVRQSKAMEDIAFIMKRDTEKIDEIHHITHDTNSRMITLPDTVTTRVLAALLERIETLEKTSNVTHENVKRVNTNLIKLGNYVQKGK